MSEFERLKEICRALIEEYSISDFVEDVRDTVKNDSEIYGEFDGPSWDHPAVVRCAELFEEMEEICGIGSSR